MNNRVIAWLVRCAPMLFLPLAANVFAQSSTQAVTINYGVVTAVGTLAQYTVDLIGGRYGPPATPADFGVL